jgi:hypothetical protein
LRLINEIYLNLLFILKKFILIVLIVGLHVARGANSPAVEAEMQRLMPLDSASHSTPLTIPPRDVVADAARDQRLKRIGAVLALTLLGVRGAWKSKKTTQASKNRAQ